MDKEGGNGLMRGSSNFLVWGDNPPGVEGLWGRILGNNVKHLRLDINSNSSDPLWMDVSLKY